MVEFILLLGLINNNIVDLSKLFCAPFSISLQHNNILLCKLLFYEVRKNIFNFLQHIVRIVIVITSVLHHIHVSVLMAGREMIACKVTTDGYIYIPIP